MKRLRPFDPRPWPTLWLIALATLVAAAPAHAGPLFTAPFYEFFSGSGPTGIGVADFNADGIPDLGVANLDGTISLMLGAGDGVFAPPLNYAVGASPQVVTIADFNGDGKPDVAIGNTFSNNVSILLNLGGLLGPRVDYVTGPAFSVAAGDLNGDGRVDLAVAAYSNHQVVTLLGNGDGTFTSGATFSGYGYTHGVAIADVNQDGTADLVISNSSNNIVTRDDPGQIVVSDVNGDEHPDLAIVCVAGTAVTELLGAGDGTFPTRVDRTLPSVPRGAVVQDLNQDGRPDLAISMGSYGIGPGEIPGAVAVALGNGDGSFASPTWLATGGFCQGIACGDWNGDGALDLAASDNGSTGVASEVVVYLGHGDATFGTRHEASTGSAPRGVVAADFDGDGKMDVVTANETSNSISFLAGLGNGDFAPKSDFAAGGRPYAVATADFNADGILDLAVADYDSNVVSVLLGNGAGSFGAPTTFATATHPLALVTGDFDFDGKPDIAAACELGQADAMPPYPEAVAIGDLNGDGRPDMVTGSSAPPKYVSVRLGQTGGTFGSVTNYAFPAVPSSVVIADLDGDGTPDVAVGREIDAIISVLHGNGDGTLGARKDFTTAPDVRALAVGDLDGDGHPDLAAAIQSTHTISWLRGSAAGLNGTHYEYGSAATPRAVALADFNGDGRTDIVAAGAGGDRVAVLLNTGQTPPTAVPHDRTPSLHARLLPIRPNPGRDAFLVRFELPRREAAEVGIFDVGGRCARVLIREERSAGMQSASWDGRGDSGDPVSPGLYWVRLRAGDEIWMARCVVLR